ncbi:DUF6283 family protein [Kitasatospora purpeofusca]|uniref:DUF6283 family protein n=1 Tax=Kitasatospora purpeofusca TaxID=67352 RepID=UPI00365C30F5
MKHRTFPCAASRTSGACPWRRDAAPFEFGAGDFEAMRETSEQPDASGDPDDYGRAAHGQMLFACHSGDPDDLRNADTDVACAGWLASGAATAGNLRVRLAVAAGRLPAECLTPREGWPELYASYDEMVRETADPDR